MAGACCESDSDEELLLDLIDAAPARTPARKAAPTAPPSDRQQVKAAAPSTSFSSAFAHVEVPAAPKKQSAPAAAAARPVASDGVEPRSGLKVVQRTVSNKELDDKLSGVKFVSLPGVAAYARKNTSKRNTRWATVGVIARKSEPREESKRHTKYMVVTLTDLAGTELSLFLFGEAYTAFWKTVPGTVVCVACADALPSREGTKNISLKVNGSGNLLCVGQAADFGFCKGQTQTGARCTQVVNLSDKPYCTFHIRQAYKKSLQGRTQLNRTSGTGKKFMSFDRNPPKKLSTGTYDVNGSLVNASPTKQPLMPPRPVPIKLRRSTSSSSSSSSSSKKKARTAEVLEEIKKQSKSRRLDIMREKKKAKAKRLAALKSKSTAQTLKELADITNKGDDDDGSSSSDDDDDDELVIQPPPGPRPSKRQRILREAVEGHRALRAAPVLARGRPAKTITTARRSSSSLAHVRYAKRTPAPVASRTAPHPTSRVVEHLNPGIRSTLETVRAHGGIAPPDPNNPSARLKLRKRTVSQREQDAELSKALEAFAERSEPVASSFSAAFADVDISQAATTQSVNIAAVEDEEHRSFMAMMAGMQRAEALAEMLEQCQHMTVKAYACETCKEVTKRFPEGCKMQQHKIREVKVKQTYWECYDCGSVMTSLKKVPVKCQRCLGSSLRKSNLRAYEEGRQRVIGGAFLPDQKQH